MRMKCDPRIAVSYHIKKQPGQTGMSWRKLWKRCLQEDTIDRPAHTLESLTRQFIQLMYKVRQRKIKVLIKEIPITNVKENQSC